MWLILHNNCAPIDPNFRVIVWWRKPAKCKDFSIQINLLTAKDSMQNILQIGGENQWLCQMNNLPAPPPNYCQYQSLTLPDDVVAALKNFGSNGMQPFQFVMFTCSFLGMGISIYDNFREIYSGFYTTPLDLIMALQVSIVGWGCHEFAQFEDAEFFVTYIGVSALAVNKIDCNLFGDNGVLCGNLWFITGTWEASNLEQFLVTGDNEQNICLKAVPTL